MDQSIEVERRYLACLWLNEIEGHDAAVIAGLTSDDFLAEEHSFIFWYVCVRAEAGAKPDVFACCREAARAGLQISIEELCDLILTHHRKSEIDFYASDVVKMHTERRSEECRAVVRDTLRAVARGLEIEAKWHAKERKNVRQNLRVAG